MGRRQLTKDRKLRKSDLPKSLQPFIISKKAGLFIAVGKTTGKRRTK